MSVPPAPNPSLVHTSPSPIHLTTTNRESKGVVKSTKTLSRYSQLLVSTTNTTSEKAASSVNLPSLLIGDLPQNRTRRYAVVHTPDLPTGHAVVTAAQTSVESGDLGEITMQMFIDSYTSRFRSGSTESLPIADTQEALDTYMAHGIPYINRVPNT